MKRFSRLLAIGGAAALLAAGPAFAHADLVSSTPAANARLAASPRTIRLRFDEQLVPAFSKIELSMPAHGMKISVRSTLSQDGKTLVGTPVSRLAKGSYRVSWSVGSADGHKEAGQFTFRVS